jgi:hypothetical protein
MIEPVVISGWPASDVPASSEPAAEQHITTVEPEPQSTRRTNMFMAELSKAMQAAVENARTETLARLEAEAKTVVDEIQAGASNEASELRARADGDVAAIRDWSKSEIARVREETEARIAARKAALEDEMEQHSATIEARVERVSVVVAAYEAELAGFFERLNAEEDPTRIATMAEAMPDPPSLAAVAASITSAAEPSAERLARVLSPVSDEPDSTSDSTSTDFAAAEAEAASITDDLGSEYVLPAPHGDELNGATVEEPAPELEATLVEPTTTRVVVSGLVSVANIANFKRSLGHVPGVTNIAVASGRDGDFAFTVGHKLGSGLAEAVRTLAGFDVEITAQTDESIVVSANDRDSNG